MRHALRDVARTVLGVNEANIAAKRSKIKYSLQFLFYLTTRGTDYEHRRADTDVLRWLSAANPASHHEAARNLCHESTGQWLIHKEDYLTWRDGAGHLVWLNGIRGLVPFVNILCQLLTLCSGLWENNFVVRQIHFLLDSRSYLTRWCLSSTVIEDVV